MSVLLALDPESKRIAGIWELYFLVTAAGMIWAYILLRIRGLTIKDIGRCILLGVLPTALLWLSLDSTVTQWFQLRVIEAIGTWPEGIEKALGTVLAGWFSWSFVFGVLIRDRITRHRQTMNELVSETKA